MRNLFVRQGWISSYKGLFIITELDLFCFRAKSSIFFEIPHSAWATYRFNNLPWNEVNTFFFFFIVPRIELEDKGNIGFTREYNRPLKIWWKNIIIYGFFRFVRKYRYLSSFNILPCSHKYSLVFENLMHISLLIKMICVIKKFKRRFFFWMFDINALCGYICGSKSELGETMCYLSTISIWSSHCDKFSKSLKTRPNDFAVSKSQVIWIFKSSLFIHW